MGVPPIPPNTSVIIDETTTGPKPARTAYARIKFEERTSVPDATCIA
jgi:hypothetical protein